jgi:hypothetical protein
MLTVFGRTVYIRLSITLKDRANRGRFCTREGSSCPPRVNNPSLSLEPGRRRPRCGGFAGCAIYWLGYDDRGRGPSSLRASATLKTMLLDQATVPSFLRSGRGAHDGEVEGASGSIDLGHERPHGGPSGGTVQIGNHAFGSSQSAAASFQAERQAVDRAARSVAASDLAHLGPGGSGGADGRGLHSSEADTECRSRGVIQMRALGAVAVRDERC